MPFRVQEAPSTITGLAWPLKSQSSHCLHNCLSGPKTASGLHDHTRWTLKIANPLELHHFFFPSLTIGHVAHGTVFSAGIPRIGECGPCHFRAATSAFHKDIQAEWDSSAVSTSSCPWNTVRPNKLKLEFGAEKGLFAGSCKETGGSCPKKPRAPQRVLAERF